MAEDIVAIAKSLFVNRINDHAAAALVFYDYFLVFDREVGFIWSRASSTLSLLFFTIRYPTLIAVVGHFLVLAQWRGESNLDLTLWTSCAILVRTQVTLSFIATTACAVFSALRAFALCDGNCYILVSLLICGIINPAIIAYGLGVVQHPSLVTYPSVTCSFDVTISPEVQYLRGMIGARVAAMIADIIVLALTWARTWSLRVEAQRIRHHNLSKECALFVVNLVGLGFSRSLYLALPLTSWIAGLTAFLTSRFMLDLLEASQGLAGTDAYLLWSAGGRFSLTFCHNAELLRLGSTEDEYALGAEIRTETTDP